MAAALLEMRSISKSFGGVAALREVDFSVASGEVHALVGENGAGKSTLIKILTGAYHRDAGTISLAGEAVDFHSPQHAQAQGVVAVYQEVPLLGTRSVAENILLGREPTRGGMVDWRALRRSASETLATLGIEIDPDTRLDHLNIAQQQMVALARAASLQPKVLVLDEPSSALAGREVTLLFDVIHRLRSTGVAIVYISHRFDELYALCDRVTILRDGRNIATRPMRDLSRVELIHLMLGSDMPAHHPSSAEPSKAPSDTAILRCSELRTDRLHGVTFDVPRGAVMGLAGTLGSGRTETLRAIFGLDRLESGEVAIEGEAVDIRNPRQAIARGLAYLPEDRRADGIIPELSVRENLTLAVLPRLSRLGIVDRARQREMVTQFVSRLRIRAASLDQPIRDLSGGNQQKVILARWLLTNPILLLADEPTRGIDIGARREIETLLAEMASQGLSLVLVSSELAELIEIAKRIVVLREGHSVAALADCEISECNIIRAMAGEAPSAEPGGAPVVQEPSVTGEDNIAQDTLPQRSVETPRRRRVEWGPKYGAILALALLVVLNSLLTSNFASASNFWNILLQVSPSLLLAIGMTVVLATGGVDLSVGSTMALTSAVTILALPMGTSTAIALGLLSGLGVGFVNGVFVGWLSVEPFIATLATQISVRGLAQLITSGSQLLPFSNPWLEWIGQGRVASVPVPAIIALAAVAAYVVIVRFTTLGRYFLAVGGNASAAYIAGVPVQRAKMLAYIGTGVMAAMAGVIETARLGATDPANIGLNMEFAAIAGAVIGGTALSGGRARLLGTVAGALILVVISTSLNMLGLSTAWTYLVQALIILAAVAIQRVRSA